MRPSILHILSFINKIDKTLRLESEICRLLGFLEFRLRFAKHFFEVEASLRINKSSEIVRVIRATKEHVYELALFKIVFADELPEVRNDC